jgi:hypothetical protein
MGPTKVVIKQDALYDAKSGKQIRKGLSTLKQIQDYAARHYIALPVVDKAGRPWVLDGKPVYCFHGATYETLEDNRLPLARCPDCGGMAIRTDEPTVESDCVRCTQCDHEFNTRLGMMES